MTQEDALATMKIVVDRADWGDFYEHFLKAAARYDPEKALFKTFLNLCYKRWRIDKLRRKIRHEPFHRTIDEVFDVPAPLAMRRDDREMEILRTAVSRLTDRDRQLLEMACVHGFTYSSIASTMGLPLGTVKSTLTRVKQRMRACLKT